MPSSSSSSSSSPTRAGSVFSVFLPQRSPDPRKASKPPVWTLLPSAPMTNADPETPLSDKCPRGVKNCCRELTEEGRTLIDPDIIRDIIIGLSDGLTVPFALTAGLSYLGESKFVVLAGLAELIAGAISMGIGGFLASQSERDHYRYLKQRTRQRVERSCEGEMAREVTEVLEPVGVDERVCLAVARSLREAEGAVKEDEVADQLDNGDQEQATLLWRRDVGQPSKDVGLAAFLLKFGQGLEEVPGRRMYISALTIGVSYLLGGFIPLLPYLFIPQAQTALMYSVLVTGMVLLVFGAIKAHVTGAGISTYSYIWGSISTFLVGGVAAGAAFGIVKALERPDSL